MKRLTSDTTDEFGAEIDRPHGVIGLGMRRPIGAAVFGCLLVIVIAAASAADEIDRDHVPSVEIFTVVAILLFGVIALVVRHKRHARRSRPT